MVQVVIFPTVFYKTTRMENGCKYFRDVFSQMSQIPGLYGGVNKFIIIIYLFSKMEKYSWIKQENTEQGEPGSYERLRKPLHAYSLSNLVQWKRRNTHKNIKH